MGSELHARGLPFEVCYEELNRSRPELVAGIHDEFAHAGANVITTNTFGANAIRLARHGLAGEGRDINRAGVRLARSVARVSASSGVAYVAGSIGPTGLRFDRSDRALHLSAARSAFNAQAEYLAAEGIDLLVLETMCHPAELLLAVEAVRDAVGSSMPLIAQMSVDSTQQMADGSSVVAMGRALIDLGVDAIGVNCSTGTQTVAIAVERLLPLGVPLTAVPSAGLPQQTGDRLEYPETPASFGVFAHHLFALGVRLVGGCCGATPEHIRCIAAASHGARVRP
jgi:methionine synthase / methylenetetrahydrofolate reductase(NADPH)